MKAMKGKSSKGKTAMNGKAKKGVVRKALGFVAKHPKTSAGVLVAGVGAYALLRRGKKAGKKAAPKVGGAGRRGPRKPAAS